MISERNKHEMNNGSLSANPTIYTIDIEPDKQKRTSNGIFFTPTKNNVEPKDLSNHQKGVSITANALETDGNPLETEKRNSLSEYLDEPGLCNTIFSWRGGMYLLLHVSFIALNLPRSSMNMAFVCINTKREEVLSMANMSLADIEEDGWSAVENNSKSAVNGNRSILEQYSHIMNDINWDSSTMGLTLAGTLFLSCIGPLLFDAIRQLIGSRNVIGITLITNAILMFTSPVMARTSPYLFLANRILLGLTMGGNASIIGAVLPRWTPEKQRLTATTIVFAGYNVGAVVSSIWNGFLCSISIDNGWPFIFYVSGMLLVVYAVAWFFFMADSPESHRFISEREKTYIQLTRSKALGENKKKSNRPPYLAIAKSVPVLAYMFVFSCFVWTMSVSVVYIPIYLNTVLGFNAEMTGILFAVISCTRVIGSLTWTSVGNYLTNSGLLSQSATRKTCICVGLSCAAICCGAVSFFGRDDKWVAITFIMAAMFLQSVATSHLGTLPMELAPRYAGTLMSIAMSVALLIALTGPLAVASLTPTNSYSEWRVVWYMLSAIFLTASLVFLIFGQAKIQPWAAMTPETGETNKDIEQQSTDVSMSPVVEFSESDKTQGSNGQVMSLEPEGSQSNHAEINGNNYNETSQESEIQSPQPQAGSPSEFERGHKEDKYSSPEMSPSKVESGSVTSTGESLITNSTPEIDRDNLAFETDASLEVTDNKPTSQTDSLPDILSSKIEKIRPALEQDFKLEGPQTKIERDNPAFENIPQEISISKLNINYFSSAKNVSMGQPDSKIEGEILPLSTNGEILQPEVNKLNSQQEQEKRIIQIIASTKL